jgi:hypothetical protein
MRLMNVGVFVFDDVEVLDFAAPFEVFSRTRMQPGVESDIQVMAHRSTCIASHKRRPL